MLCCYYAVLARFADGGGRRQIRRVASNNTESPSTLTVEVGVEAVPQVGARAKVDQLQVEGLEVHQQVLILDVPVDDATSVASNDGLHYLTEEVAGQLLFQHPLFSDVVEEVLAGLWPLHHDDVGVMSLKAVDESDHPGETGHRAHQADLHGNTLSINLEKKLHI